MEEVQRTLARNIKHRREILGMTQQQLAEEAGYSRGAIAQFETCVTWLDPKTISALSKALKVSPGELFRSETDVSAEFRRAEEDHAALIEAAKDQRTHGGIIAGLKQQILRQFEVLNSMQVGIDGACEPRDELVALLSSLDHTQVAAYLKAMRAEIAASRGEQPQADSAERTTKAR